MTPIRRSCPVCQGAFSVLVRKIADWEYGVPFNSELIECRQCGLVTHEPPISAEQIPGLYPSNYLAHGGQSAGRGVYGRLKQTLRERSSSKIASKVPQGGTFMEIGCGNCQLIRELGAARPDVELVGVDIEAVAIEPIPRFSFYHGQLEDVAIAPASIDLIYCSNLIEHVADPRRFLTLCNRALKPGGLIYGVTPDHASLDRRVFGRYWAGYHYPRHTFLFNHSNLKLLLEQERFAQVNITGSYSFWYLSLANRFVELPGTKRRGLLFALTTALFFPLDLLLNVITTHGSMSFLAAKNGPAWATQPPALDHS